MKTFLGKQIKSYSESKWKIVESSVQKIKTSELKKVKQIIVLQSEYDEEQLYAKIELNEGYVTFTIDSRCSKHLEVGDKLDPKTIQVYDLTNGEKTINRLFGKKLD